MRVLLDHAAIAAVLDQTIAADPVRGTILGSVRRSLGPAAWLALARDGLAARSSATYPVTLAGRWTSAEREELATSLRELPDLAGVSGAPDDVTALVAALNHENAREFRQRLFRLEQLTAPVGVTGSARLATAQDRDLLIAWILAFVQEAGVPENDVPAYVDRLVAEDECWLWCDPAPVSMAARRGAVFGSARVGPVYTPPEHRGRGYGSAATAAATRSILHDGAVPVLFTDLANPTSNKIYRLLGYRPVEDRAVTFFR